jgi:hypothetical protein
VLAVDRFLTLLLSKEVQYRRGIHISSRLAHDCMLSIAKPEACSLTANNRIANLSCRTGSTRLRLRKDSLYAAVHP